MIIVCTACNCHEKNKEAEEQRLAEARLIAQRSHLESISASLYTVRASMNYHDPKFHLLVAVEQLWIIEKRRLNKKLLQKGLKQIKR